MLNILPKGFWRFAQKMLTTYEEKLNLPGRLVVLSLALFLIVLFLSGAAVVATAAFRFIAN